MTNRMNKGERNEGDKGSNKVKEARMRRKIIRSKGKGKKWGKLTKYEMGKGKEETFWGVKIQKKLFSVEFQCAFCTSLLLIFG